MIMLFIPEKEHDKYTWADRKDYRIKPVKMIEGYALPVDLLTDVRYKFAWELLSQLEKKEMTPIPDPEIPE